MRKLLLLLLLLAGVGASAQHFRNPFFNSIRVETGLPEGYVTSSIQDKYGYLWLATQIGVVRYDGYQLKQFPLRNLKGEILSFNTVYHMEEDREGRVVMIVMNKGFYVFDRTKEEFRQLPVDSTFLSGFSENGYLIDFNNESGKYWVGGQRVNAAINYISLLDPATGKYVEYGTGVTGANYLPMHFSVDMEKDARDRMWLIADSALFRFDNSSKKFETVFIHPMAKDGTIFSEIVFGENDPDIVWLSSYTKGKRTMAGDPNPIYRYNIKTKAAEVYQPDQMKPGSLVDHTIHLFSDSMHRVWVATERGISLYDQASNSFRNYFFRLPRSLTDEKTHIENIASDANGDLWMGGQFKGLLLLHVKTGTSSYYAHNSNPGSIVDHYGIQRMFFDRTGSFWINTPYYGVSRLDRKKSLFNPFNIEPGSDGAGGIVTRDMFFIYESYQDSLFYVKDSSNLYEWNYNSNKFTNIDLKNHSVYKQINTIYRSPDDKLWIGTGGVGLYCYDIKTKQSKHYAPDFTDPKKLGTRNIQSLIRGPDGMIYLGTRFNGLFRLDPRTDEFFNYPYIANTGTLRTVDSIDDRTVNALYVDKEGILWAGTNLGGINRVDTETGKITSFLDAKRSFNCVAVMMEDSKGRFWAGTYLTGLFILDRKTFALKHFSEANGLIYNSITSLSEDRDGNIWVSTARGFSKIEPVSGRITNFPMNDFNRGRFDGNFFPGANGELRVSTTGGLISFDPRDIGGDTIPPLVLVEAISYRPSSSKLDTTIALTGRDVVRLQHRENKITLRFIALHFEDAEKNQYKYMLEGYDKNWINGGTQRTVTYTNLSPGTYTFKVMGANSDGVWNQTPATIRIVIASPWWLSWWAWCIYALIVGAVIWTFANYRSRSLKKENLVLEQKVEHRTSQLRESIDQLKTTQTQLVHAEKMASLGELTAGIAHEIQNPLNFVNNFSELNAELIDEMNAEIEKGNFDEVKSISNDIKENEQKINHHGKRADAIVKGMLQHSRSSSGTKQPTDINALCDEYLRLSYHGLRAKDKSMTTGQAGFNASMKTDFDLSIGLINVEPQDIGRVILNMLTNAFYAVNQKRIALANNAESDTHYEPAVSIATKKMDRHVEIRIADNGSGIPKDVLDKVFQPFFTTKPTGQGTGLGLSLSYDIVTKGHGGEIKMTTKEGEGTNFTIILPT